MKRMFQREPTRIKSIGYWLLTIFVSLFLTGCFDIEERVIINSVGGGSITVKVKTEPIIGKQIKGEHFLEVEGAGIKKTVKNYIEKDKFYHVETVTFDRLSDIAIKDEYIKLEVTRTGFIMREVNFEHHMFPAESDAQAAALFIRRHFIYTVRLPGVIEKAYPLVVDSIEVKPIVGRDTATWKVPLDLILPQGEAVFKVNFKVGLFGRLGFKNKIESKAAEEF
ncbi:MAG TPA: hypothetical protein EYP60_03685 [bacterium (Candidatus Stahlbacteria)]|nr:hypothetical protein [Candidatus Stahlbacteria bacterium]